MDPMTEKIVMATASVIDGYFLGFGNEKPSPDYTNNLILLDPSDAFVKGGIQEPHHVAAQRCVDQQKPRLLRYVGLEVGNGGEMVVQVVAKVPLKP